MTRFKVLVLTDHSGHSKENSVYAMLAEMLLHDQCYSIDIASRGLAVNQDFFKQCNFDIIHASSVTSEFQFDDIGSAFQYKLRQVKLNHYDIVFLRLPRPVSDQFLLKLKIDFPNVVFINDPQGIITCSTKAFLTHFPDSCPPMQMCYSVEEVMSFSEQFDIVLKPIKEYGGKGLVKIVNGIVNDGNSDYPKIEYLAKLEVQLKSEGYLAMKYLKNVVNGDKRLLVVNGEILGASLRLPPPNSWLCNVALGGKSIAAMPDKRELEIVENVYPTLKKHGILICGLDTLEDDDGNRILSEINALSIGGFPQAQKQTGKPIIKTTIDKIFEYASR